MKRKNAWIAKTYFVFLFCWELLCFKKQFEYGNKNSVKEDNTVVRFTHPPLDAVIINCKGTEINASPFTEHHVNTPISIETKKIIEQKNFVNNSLHIIGQQLNRIEEKVEKPTSSIKIEQPLIDLPGQRHNLSFKTTQTKTIEKVEQMLFDLQKMKTKQNNTSTSTTRAISKKGKEISSSKDLDINSWSFVSDFEKI